jgi:hypothetical protein
MVPSSAPDASASTQDKGAASTDLTAESGAAPAQTLAADWPAPTVSKPTAEQDQAEHTDREALALAQLYALYLSAHRSHNTAIATVMARPRLWLWLRSYDDCDD